MTHQMQLQPEPFDMIKSDEKTIELRLYDEKRRKIRIGDEIVFTNTENGETLAVRVIDLAVFASVAAVRIYGAGHCLGIAA